MTPQRKQGDECTVKNGMTHQSEGPDLRQDLPPLPPVFYQNPRLQPGLAVGKIPVCLNRRNPELGPYSHSNDEQEHILLSL